MMLSNKSDEKLRSNQFPYHLTTTPNLAKVPTALAKKKKDIRRNYMYSESPTTYMVVNFDEEFVESLPSEMPPIMHVNDAKTKTIIEKIRKNSPERKDKLPRAPGLNSSYLLPKYVDPDVAAERLMFRRKDAGTQTDLNMNKCVFEGMTGYQHWTSEVVEPFLKVITKSNCTEASSLVFVSNRQLFILPNVMSAFSTC